jgi:glycosyltransferase EpsE
MAERPLVSVLMGVYQIEKLACFSTTMESLLHQSYQQIEILICNDGSTDTTADILLEWEHRDKRIRILNHDKNYGLAAALNTCIAEANGVYFARQDADDVSHLTRLEEQVAFLENHPNIDFLGTNVALCDAQGVWGERRLPEVPKKQDFLFCSPFVHGTVMYRAAALHKAGGYRVCKYTRRAEDYDLFMRMYALGMEGANLQNNLYDYREDRENMDKRKYRYRLDEVVVRYRGFRSLGLLPAGLPYVIKPLLVGLLTNRFLFWLKCKLRIFNKTTGEPPC